MKNQKSKQNDSGLFKVCWEPLLLFSNFQTFIKLDIFNKMLSPSMWHAKSSTFTEFLLTEETDFYKLSETHLSYIQEGLSDVRTCLNLLNSRVHRTFLGTPFNFHNYCETRRRKMNTQTQRQYINIHSHRSLASL
jgi:hypothetical protein